MKRFVFLCLASLFVCQQAQASYVVANYDFESAGGSTNSKDNDAGSTASAITLGSQLNTVTIASSGGNPGGNQYILFNDTVTSGANSYFSFTISSASLFDLASISFDVLKTTTSNADPTVEISYTKNSPTPSTSGSVGSVVLVDSLATWTSASTKTFDLSSLPLVTSITFKFLLVDTQGGSNDGYRFDNIIVRAADLATPEPTALSLAGLGAIGALAGLRRRQQAV